MSWQEVKSNFDYLNAEQDSGSLRWHKEVANTFTRLLGSGYIAGSIRSLWGLYPKDKSAAISLLLELAERWRSYLRDNRGHEQNIQKEFVQISQGLLECIEGQREFPSSFLFQIRDGVAHWTDELSKPGEA